jgi:phosphoribosylglycinamide formyltransferase-1
MVPDTLNIAVFASGRGSNFKAILDEMEEGKIQNARIVLVVSNNPGAGALTVAREHTIPCVHLSRKQFDSDTSFNDGILETLRKHGVNFIALAGYMKKIDSAIVRAFKNRILNVHPALLPAFGGAGMYGMFVHQAVIASKARFSGATVHIVDEEYDRGPVVLQERVEIAEDETPETLAEKVLQVEHRIYPEAIRLFAAGRVTVSGRQISITEQS